MTIDLESAKKLAADYIATVHRQHPLAIESVSENEAGWTVTLNAAEYVRTGDIAEMLHPNYSVFVTRGGAMYEVSYLVPWSPEDLSNLRRIDWPPPDRPRTEWRFRVRPDGVIESDPPEAP